jgi:hypothetical protein
VSAVHPAVLSAARLWAGVLVAPAAWIAQGALGWYFGYQACAGMTVDAARAAIGIISAAALAATIGGGWLAWINWGRTTADRHPMDVKGWDRLEFMSASGVLVSGIFAIGVAWAALSGALLHGCGGMR